MLRVRKTEIDQSELTGECWTIQMWGIEACSDCRYRGKPRLCGGKKIREKLMNEKGKSVPLGKVVDTVTNTIEEALRT